MPAIVELFASSEAFFLSVVFVVSLMVGSFLNVVIHRLPIMLERDWKKEYQSYFHPDEAYQAPERYNLIKPDSCCPNCQHKIRVWENIPLLSWLWLKGKCSQCATPISVRYPLVELLSALLSLWAAWHFGFGAQGLLAVLLTWALLALTCIDLDKMLLPDNITLPLLWLGLLVNLNGTFTSLPDATIGAAAGYLSLWSLYWGFKLLTGKEGMGYGDFKLLAALGAWLGWQQLPVIILLSSFVGALAGIALIISKRNQGSQAIPFGPYLAVAGWLAMLYGEAIRAWYWQTLV